MSKKSYNRPLEHKQYIQLKYLSGSIEDQNEKKKKKKVLKHVTKNRKVRIFDDDIDLKNIDTNRSDDELYYGTKEEKPMIAGIVDERPLHMRRSDIDTNRWKTIGSDGEQVVNKSENNDLIQSKDNSVSKDLSPQKESIKRLRHDSDSDLSPIRHEVRKDDSKSISLKSKRHDSDSDLSPPRTKSRSDSSRVRRHDSDSDLSPPRETRYSSKSQSSRQSIDSKLISRNDKQLNKNSSPQRYKSRNIEKTSDSKRNDSDSDLSPPRTHRDNNKKRSELTLAGKKSGLSDAKELRDELMSVKKKEQKLFASVSDEKLGKNAKTVFRDSKSGRIRDLEEEARLKYKEDSIKEKINSEKKAKYEKWSKGLVQKEQQEQRLRSDLHEMSKPMARYGDDTDLDQLLREREREDDPMLATIRLNKTKEQLKDGNPVKPIYSGPTPPLNRFNIRPGYRWDGVNRSNGFEHKYFERISNKESAIEEAYKWSTQDM